MDRNEMTLRLVLSWLECIQYKVPRSKEEDIWTNIVNNSCEIVDKIVKRNSELGTGDGLL